MTPTGGGHLPARVEREGERRRRRNGPGRGEKPRAGSWAGAGKRPLWRKRERGGEEGPRLTGPGGRGMREKREAAGRVAGREKKGRKGEGKRGRLGWAQRRREGGGERKKKKNLNMKFKFKFNPNKLQPMNQCKEHEMHNHMVSLIFIFYT
jgi:hypothetical protein